MTSHDRYLAETQPALTGLAYCSWSAGVHERALDADVLRCGVGDEMSELKIEKNIPMLGSYAKSKYPLAAMDVGDSFFIEAGSLKQRQAITALARRLNMKVSIRQVLGGLRCWRTR